MFYLLRVSKENAVSRRSFRFDGFQVKIPSLNKHQKLEIENIILKEAEKLFSELCAANDRSVNENHPFEFLPRNEIPKLSSEMRSICEGKLSVKECFIVFSHSKNKSPGNDTLFHRGCFTKKERKSEMEKSGVAAREETSARLFWIPRALAKFSFFRTDLNRAKIFLY